MFPFRTVELAFRRFQTRREPRALAFVFDRTAADLLALARHLSPQGQEPEDLVQATFVTAIEAADSHRHGERVLPWLCGILANHARVARRRAQRSVEAARVPQAVGDAAREAEASELRAELQAAIDRLPEVYRPVLRLVFAHGLQANEVARALERPAGTVRAQVTRGLELLRRSLPAGLAGSVAVTAATGRGLAAVRQSVLGKVGGAGLGAVPPLLIGGWIVLQHKLAAAAAAALVAALGLFWFLQQPPPPLAPPPGTIDTAAVATAPLGRDTGEDASSAERDRVADAADPATTAAPAAAPAPAGASVVVHVRAADGTPQPGVQVAVFPFVQLQDLGRRMDYVRTDARGDVRFDGSAAGDLAIDVDRLGMAGVVTAVPGKTIERDVLLPAGVRVAGRVVDLRGAPVAGAQLVLHGSRASAVGVGRTDDRGTFTVEHLTAGVELQACMPNRVPSLVHTVRGGPGAAMQIELVLGDAACTVRGVVRDPDGRPAAGATVAILPANARTVSPPDPSRPQVRAQWLRTASDGTFACHEVAAGPQIVFARRLPFAPQWTEVEVAAGETGVELQLPRGGTLEGHVTRGGAPVADVTVLTWPSQEVAIGYLLNLFGMRHTMSATDGTFRIDGLVAGAQSVRLMQGTSLLRQETRTFADGVTTNLHVDLATGDGLRVVVEGAAPLREQRAMLLAYPNPLRDGEPPSMTALGADGTALLQLPRDGDLDVVLCTMPGGQSLVQIAAARGVPPSQDEGVLELRPEQLPQRAITGRLVDAQRAPLPGRTLTAARTDGGLVVRVGTTTDADGAFAVGPLPAGDYMLMEGPPNAPRLVGRATVTVDRDEAIGDLVLAPQ